MTDSSAALAVTVYRLKERLDSIQDEVNSLQAVVNGHSSLGADLADLTQRVRALVAAVEERDTQAPAPVWSGLTAAEHDAQFRQLAVFVDQHLRVTYGDYLEEVLHACWPQHPGALWELGNLHAEWDRVYRGQRPSLAGALTWHDRWLPGVRSRLAVTMRDCQENRCRLQRPQVPGGWGTR